MTKKQIKELTRRNEKIAEIILPKLTGAERQMFIEYVDNEILLEAESNK
jgi:hypothetical protein